MTASTHHRRLCRYADEDGDKGEAIEYDASVDLWSVGVVLYILLCGFPPFYGDNDAQMFKRIKTGQFKFLSPYWDDISMDAKDFVSKLLVVDVKGRMSAKEAAKHRWISDSEMTMVEKLEEEMTRAVSVAACAWATGGTRCSFASTRTAPRDGR